MIGWVERERQTDKERNRGIECKSVIETEGIRGLGRREMLLDLQRLQLLPLLMTVTRMTATIIHLTLITQIQVLDVLQNCCRRSHETQN